MIADESVALVSLNAAFVAALVSLAIPVLIGLVTNASTSPKIKGVLTLVLTAVNALIVTATQADGTAVISKEAFFTWAIALGVAVASYVGIYRPLGITSTPNGEGKALLNRPPKP